MQPKGSLVVACGFASERGRRDANEDYCAIYLGTDGERATHGIVAAVADGIGGAKGGRIAAELAVRSFIDGYYGASPTIGIAAGGAAAMRGFNRWLNAMAACDPEMEGAGTTFTALVLRGRRAHGLHVGDSRAWHFRSGTLARLTEDHVLPQRDLRHVLYRAIGLEQSVRLDGKEIEIAVHDRLLLTSDGVHGALSDRSLARLLERRGAPQADAAMIVEAALDAGSADNVTAVVLDVVELPAADQDGIAIRAAELPILPPPVEGATVDGFTLRRLLSDGRYSRIFLASDDAGGDEAVLKFPKPATLSEQGAQLAFLRETLIGSRVQNPFVGEVLLLPPERQTRLYVALRYYPGETLEARLSRGPLPLASGLATATKAAQAIAALHRLGIIHRDIKPDNILITDEGGLRLIDLGVARLPRVEEFAGAEIPGTPSYMAPELFEGARGSEASDQFAFGCMLFRIFLDRYPYGEVEAFSRPRFGRPVQPGKVRSELPAWLEAAMLRSVALRPEDRFGDMLELLAVIEGGSARATPKPRRRSLYERDPLRFWQFVALVLAIALVAAVIVR